MVIINDLEWPMLSYYGMYYEKFRKILQRIEKEALSIYNLRDSDNPVGFIYNSANVRDIIFW